MTTEDDLMDMVNKIIAQNSDNVSAMGAAILVATEREICQDSLSFARIFEVGHAVVIRECNSLAEEVRFLNIDGRKESSQRLKYSLTTEAKTMLEQIT